MVTHTSDTFHSSVQVEASFIQRPLHLETDLPKSGGKCTINGDGPVVFEMYEAVTLTQQGFEFAPGKGTLRCSYPVVVKTSVRKSQHVLGERQGKTFTT